MKTSWQIKTIGDVCDVVNGGTPKTGVAEYWDGPHQWVTPAEMGKRDSPFIYRSERTITDAGVKNSSARVLPKQSVILSSRAPIGHLVINSVPMATNQGCKGLVPRNGLDSKYLYYYLASIVPMLNDLGTGATFKELSGGKLKEVSIPLAPETEQQRIVSLLDEAFEGIATAKANAEKNLQNARSLFESHLKSVFSQGGPDWVEMKLGDVTAGIFTGPFGSLLHKSDYVTNGIPLVNPAHITETGIEPDFHKTVSKETVQRLKSYVLRIGDVVIGRRGEMGRCAVVSEIENGWLCGTGSFIIRPSIKSDPNYLVRLLRSEAIKSKLEEIAGGTVMPNLSNTDLGNLVLNFPPVGRQKHIVHEIDELHEKTQRLTQIYQQKIAALDELKKALLHKAFSGEL